jgi:hypothetical protein
MDDRDGVGSAADTEDSESSIGLEQLVGSAERLARGIREVRDALSGPVAGQLNRIGVRLVEAADEVESVGGMLRRTVRDLERLATVPPDACRAEWGVCPEHGSTLASAGGVTVCTSPGCTRQWDYDRLTDLCPEPVTHRITGATGTDAKVCHGHAIGARTVPGLTVSGL